MLPDRICSRCRLTLPVTEFHRFVYGRDGLKSMCKSCANAYTAKYVRLNGKRYAARTKERYWAQPEAHRLAARCHQAVGRALKRGELVRPDVCEECGKVGRIEAAHRDYARPLDVRWLCRSCHVLWDRAQPKMPHS